MIAASMAMVCSATKKRKPGVFICTHAIALNTFQTPVARKPPV